MAERHGTDLPRPHSAKKRMKKRTKKRDQYASDTAVIRIPPEYRTPVNRDLPPAQNMSRIYHESADYDDPYRRTAAAPAKRHRAGPHTRKRRKSSLLGRFVRFLCVVAAVMFCLYSAMALYLISRLEKVPEGTRTVCSGTLDRLYVRTVLLIGTDARDLSVERGRSDSMILLTINSRTHEIGLNSLMRDAYVEIPDYGSGKLNAAYSYGGAELLMDTIEQNYNVSVDDYVCVSFQGFAGVIDAFGGVEITLTDEEAEAINRILQNEVNSLMGDDPTDDFLPSGGTYLLDGKQALSFSRIRYVGNADFERTSRQREVMVQLTESARKHFADAVPKLMENALPHVSTNMSTTELYLLSLRMPFLLGYDTQQQQIPANGTWSADTVDGQSVLRVDFAANEALLRDTAYAGERRTEEAP